MNFQAVTDARHFESGAAIPLQALEARRTPEGALDWLADCGSAPGDQLRVTEIGSCLSQTCFHLQNVIARQANYVIFRACYEDYGDVALKMLWPNEQPLRKHSESLRTEANALRRLNHPSIQKCISSGLMDFDPNDIPQERVAVALRWYVATEFIPGLPLNELLKTEGPIPLSRFQSLVDQSCSAVVHAHQNGILHGDVKPSNIIHSNDDRFVLIDFNMAYVAPKESFGLAQEARRGMSILSVAPELFERIPLSPAADQYSLGVTLYASLSAHYPHEGENIKELQQKKTSQQAVDIRQYRPELSAETAAALMRSLERHPEKRYRSVSEMRQALLKTLPD